MSGPLRLHGYWRSGAAYRVRIALNLKRLAYEPVPHDLRAGEQSLAAYRAVAPHALVPALETGDGVLIQSPAIMEWLEERHPAPALLPTAPTDRAMVRGMAAIVACDVHPLNNLRVLKTLQREFGADQDRLDAWAGRWMAEGFAALETLIGRHGGGFAFGDTPTLADCCLVPQAYSAERFHVDTSAYPRLSAAVARARDHPAFIAAHPDRQPDAPPQG